MNDLIKQKEYEYNKDFDLLETLFIAWEKKYRIILTGIIFGLVGIIIYQYVFKKNETFQVILNFKGPSSHTISKYTNLQFPEEVPEIIINKKIILDEFYDIFNQGEAFYEFHKENDEVQLKNFTDIDLRKYLTNKSKQYAIDEEKFKIYYTTLNPENAVATLLMTSICSINEFENSSTLTLFILFEDFS